MSMSMYASSADYWKAQAETAQREASALREDAARWRHILASADFVRLQEAQAHAPWPELSGWRTLDREDQVLAVDAAILAAAGLGAA